MTAFSKNVYIDVLNDIVNKYNNTYHNSIKMKPIDVKCDSYAEYNLDSNAKDVEFKMDNHVRISRHKNNFAKGHNPNWSEEVLQLAKSQILYHGHMSLMILIVKMSKVHFMKKNCRRHIKRI